MKVGVSGGGSTIVLGTTLEVSNFFRTVNTILDESGIEMPLITNRLYKRYIKQSENQQFLDNLEQLTKLFKEKEVPNKDYFVYLNKCKKVIGTAEFMLENCIKDGIKYSYQPVMIVISSIPDLIIQEKIPLETRDNLTEEDKPFWLRDEDER